MDKDYLEVLAKNILKDVKVVVKNNYLILENEQKQKADSKMLSVIKSVVESQKDMIINEKEINQNIKDSFIQYYVALCYDNVDLLKKLLDSDFSFKNSYRYDLYVLDNKISSNFNIDDYVKLVKENLRVFENFYISLCKENGREKSKINDIILKFVDIIKKKQINNKLDMVDDFLTCNVLNNFTEEQIIELNDKQQKMLVGYKESDVYKLIKELILKYDYSKNLIFWDQYNKYFGIEEILQLSDTDINVYSKLFRSEIRGYENYFKLLDASVKKIKEIKSINPEFDRELEFIVYEILPIKKIMKLSDEGVDSINEILFGYSLKNMSDEEVSEDILRAWILEAYYRDRIKSSFKKLVK